MRGEDDGAVNALQHPVKARDVVHRDVSGIGADRTFRPEQSNGPITSFQLDPSAQAP
jgi:hypothetical protein